MTARAPVLLDKMKVIKYNLFSEGEIHLAEKHNKYSGEFKQKVIEYILKTGVPHHYAAKHFSIRSAATVYKWWKIYSEEGFEGLYIDRRGGGFRSMDEVENSGIAAPVDEDLNAEVKRLRMENAYLKKLNALIQEKERSGTKKKPKQ